MDGTSKKLEKVSLIVWYKILSRKPFIIQKPMPLTKKKKMKNPWICPKTFYVKTSTNPNKTKRNQNCKKLWKQWMKNKDVKQKQIHN